VLKCPNTSLLRPSETPPQVTTFCYVSVMAEQGLGSAVIAPVGETETVDDVVARLDRARSRVDQVLLDKGLDIGAQVSPQRLVDPECVRGCCFDGSEKDGGGLWSQRLSSAARSVRRGEAFQIAPAADRVHRSRICHVSRCGQARPPITIAAAP
jgi:hypothetical protein